MKRRSTILLTLMVIGTFALHLWSLIRFPALFVDEVWQMSRAWSFLQTGKTFGMLDSGVADRYPGYWTFLPWLGNVLQAIPLWLSGSLSIFGLRLLSLLFGGLLLLAIFIITRRLGGIIAAWIAVIATAYSYSFWIASHLARYDIIITAIGFSIIALYFIDEATPRWWIRVLCGLMGGLVIEIHAFGMIYVFPIIALYVWKYRWGIIRQREAWQVLGGGVVGIAFYIWMHILPYPETYFALNKLFFGPSHTIPLLSFSPSVIFREIKHTIRTIISSSSFMISLIALSTIGMMIKRTQEMKLWFVISLSLTTAFVLLLHNKFMYYNILLMPIFYIGVGIFFAWLWKEFAPSLKRQNRYILAACVVLIQLITAAEIIQIASINQYTIYDNAQIAINTFVKPNDVVLSSQVYWYGLPEHKYFTWEQMIYYRRYKPGASIQDTMEDFRPDIIAVDKQMASAISDEPKSSAFAEALRIPETELQIFLDAHATLVGTIENQLYGPIKVYRVNWEPQAYTDGFQQ